MKPLLKFTLMGEVPSQYDLIIESPNIAINCSWSGLSVCIEDPCPNDAVMMSLGKLLGGRAYTYPLRMHLYNHSDPKQFREYDKLALVLTKYGWTGLVGGKQPAVAMEFLISPESMETVHKIVCDRVDAQYKDKCEYFAHKIAEARRALE